MEYPMSKHLRNICFVFATLAVSAVSFAQVADSGRASIPFNFTVHGTSFPAGNYAVAGTSNPRIVVLRNLSNPHVSCLVVLKPGQTLAAGQAAFNVERKSASEQAGYQA